MRESRAYVALIAGLVAGISSLVLPAYADSYSSTSYKIDASVTSGAGGLQTSTNYGLTSSTGENVIGNGTAGSYKMGMGYVAQLDKALELTAQPSGLVAAYRLDELTGATVADDSTYGASGAVVGALSSVAGKLGTGLSFNGSTQAIIVGNNAQTRITTGTVEAWVKSGITTGSLAAVSKASSFWLGLGGGKATTYDWTTSTTVSDTIVIADNSWHHIAVTLNSGVTDGSTLYLDGNARRTFTWTPQFQSGPFAIGSVYNGTSHNQYFNGSIDHVKVFNRAFSADEIAAEFAAGNAGAASGISLGTIIPGASSTSLVDVITQTDAGGYSLAVNQDHDLTDGTNSISAVSGTIASPLAWSEGSTKGLGFTLAATNATAIPGAWNSGNSYAAFPGAASTFYTRTGTQTGKDYLTMRLRADVPTTLPTSSTEFNNTITITGTMTP